MINSEKKNHGIIAKSLHWSFIGLFAYGLAKGLDNVGQLSDTALLTFEMKFALVFLMILIARFIYMRMVGATALPESTSNWKKRAAKYGHLSIYLSLALIPISGMAIGGLYMIGITNGPLIGLAVGLHEASLVASYWLIGLHILAALYHRLINDGVWSAMVPFFKEKHG